MEDRHETSKSPIAPYISYLQGNESHTIGGSSLVADLRLVEFDHDEIPAPRCSGEDMSDQEIIAYQLGELSSGNLCALPGLPEVVAKMVPFVSESLLGIFLIPLIEEMQ